MLGLECIEFDIRWGAKAPTSFGFSVLRGKVLDLKGSTCDILAPLS